MISMWSQSAPELIIRWASEAKLAKSDDSIEGAIFGVTPIFLLLVLGWTLWSWLVEVVEVRQQNTQHEAKKVFTIRYWSVCKYVCFGRWLAACVCWTNVPPSFKVEYICNGLCQWKNHQIRPWIYKEQSNSSPNFLNIKLVH